MLDIKQMQDEAHAMAKKKGWWIERRSIGEVLALIHSEISEALEEARKGNMFTYYEATRPDKPEGFDIELADAVIRIMDLCGYLGLDLGKAIETKMKYNETRSYRHGKQF